MQVNAAFGRQADLLLQWLRSIHMSLTPPVASYSCVYIHLFIVLITVVSLAAAEVCVLTFRLLHSLGVSGFIQLINYCLCVSLMHVQWAGGHNVLQMVRDRSGAVVPIMNMRVTATQRTPTPHPLSSLSPLPPYSIAFPSFFHPPSPLPPYSITSSFAHALEVVAIIPQIYAEEVRVWCAGG